MWHNVFEEPWTNKPVAAGIWRELLQLHVSYRLQKLKALGSLLFLIDCGGLFLLTAVTLEMFAIQSDHESTFACKILFSSNMFSFYFAYGFNMAEMSYTIKDVIFVYVLILDWEKKRTNYVDIISIPFWYGCRCLQGAYLPVIQDGAYISQMSVQFITEVEPRMFIFGVTTTRTVMKKLNSAHLASDHLTGPYFFDGSVNHATYLIMLQKWFVLKPHEGGLESTCILQQDGTPGNNILSFRELDEDVIWNGHFKVQTLQHAIIHFGVF
jgi:hypothetical protein